MDTIRWVKVKYAKVTDLNQADTSNKGGENVDSKNPGYFLGEWALKIAGAIKTPFSFHKVHVTVTFVLCAIVFPTYTLGAMLNFCWAYDDCPLHVMR